MRIFRTQIWLNLQGPSLARTDVEQSMLSKMTHPILALALATGISATSVDQAQAGDGAGIAAGVAAGIIGLGIIGATAGARRGYYYDAYDGPPGCYRGPRTCAWEHRYCFENSYGDYVCRGATTSAGVR